MRSLRIGILVVAAIVWPSAASAAKAPVLGWTPTTSAGTYDFGVVAAGKTSTVRLALTNTGGSSTSPLSVAIAGSPALTVTSNGCANAILIPAGSCTLTVGYSPTSGGSADVAALTVSARKPAVSSTLRLTGTSVLPRQIFWSTTNDTMARANIDGTGVNLTFLTGPFGEYGVARDTTHLYWVSIPYGIGRSDLDGGNLNYAFIASRPGLTFGLDVDTSHIYFPYTDPNPASSGIARADLDGQNLNTSFITGTTDPFDVAVDVAHVYWADCTANAIGRADLNGGNVNPAFITGASCPVGVAVDGQHIYWTNATSGSIGRADVTGVNVNQALIAAGAFPFAIALDGSSVYWTDDTAGTIGRADLDGQHPSVSFISGAFAGRGIAVEP